MRIVWFLFIFLFAHYSCCFSGEVMISGTASSFKSKQISVWLVKDYISLLEDKISSAIIQSDGSFSLGFNLDSTEQVVIKLEDWRSILYASPGNKFDINILPGDSDENFLPGQRSLRYVFNNIDPNDLNPSIRKLNDRINGFVLRNYSLFLQSGIQKRFEKFRDSLNSEFGNIKGNFFQVFYVYSVASLEESALHKKKELNHKYFSGKEFYYRNNGFMSFFNQFFKQYLILYAYKNQGSSIVSAINEKSSYQKIKKAFERDTMVKDPLIRELIIIKGLSEMYYMKDFIRANVIALMDSAYLQSNFPGNKLIATNFRNSWKQLVPGSPIPEFEAMSISGKRIKSLDLKGKYTFLFFGKDQCIPCLEELKVISKIYDRYQKDLNFINVHLSENGNEITDNAKTHKFSWAIINDPQKEIIEKFSVVTFPAYFMIDPEGYFYKSPGPGPTLLEREIKLLLK